MIAKVTHARGVSMQTFGKGVKMACYIVWFGKVRPLKKGHSLLTIAVHPTMPLCIYHCLKKKIKILKKLAIHCSNTMTALLEYHDLGILPWPPPCIPHARPSTLKCSPNIFLHVRKQNLFSIPQIFIVYLQWCTSEC